MVDVRDVPGCVRAVCAVEPITVDAHERALQVADRYGLSFCDALIVASALLAGCKSLHSEDMQHRQVIERQLTIHDPFLAR